MNDKFIRLGDGVYELADPSASIDLFYPTSIESLLVRIRATRPPHFVAVSGIALEALREDAEHAPAIAASLGLDPIGVMRGQVVDRDVFLFCYTHPVPCSRLDRIKDVLNPSIPAQPAPAKEE